ncbi:MAG: cobyric acid synthase [Candidatus Odinarchaeota archaeon]
MLGKTLMIQGTTSDAGKSILVAALCRIFNDMGFKVAPFKSQNMSLNSFVTEDGAEIARSQVVQAMAARTKPIAEHNPVLLKPKGEAASQIILMGKPFRDYHVKNYYTNFIPHLIPDVKKALKNLQKNNDIIVIEGAGSPAEINLANNEIANMFIAKLINAPVILIADIERGGVFASIYGTIKLLKPEEQDLIKYFVINKFRGDLEILKPGIKQLEKLIDIKCIGVLPYIQDLKLPAEDSMSLEKNEYGGGGNLEVKIIRLPRLSNFTDFEALSWEPEIHVSYIYTPEQLVNADLIVIPGTKNTIKDLLWLEKNGFCSKLRELEKLGYLIAGICGGYQILGKCIIDKGIEGDSIGIYKGLGLLPIQTEFLSYNKITRQIQAEIIGHPYFNSQLIEGYEIHMGKVIHEQGAIPLLKVKNKRNESQDKFIGAINDKKTVFGSLIHGFWENDDFRQKFIEYLYYRKNLKKKIINKSSYKEIIEKNIQRLSKIVGKNLNIEAINNILGI